MNNIVLAQIFDIQNDSLIQEHKVECVAKRGENITRIEDNYLRDINYICSIFSQISLSVEGDIIPVGSECEGVCLQIMRPSYIRNCSIFPKALE